MLVDYFAAARGRQAASATSDGDSHFAPSWIGANRGIGLSGCLCALASGKSRRNRGPHGYSNERTRRSTDPHIWEVRWPHPCMRRYLAATIARKLSRLFPYGAELFLIVFLLHENDIADREASRRRSRAGRGKQSAGKAALGRAGLEPASPTPVRRRTGARRHGALGTQGVSKSAAPPSLGIRL